MQLKIQRSQRMGGLTGTAVFFALDVRAEYAAEEQHNIRRYKLGPQAIYNSRAAAKHLDRAAANFTAAEDRQRGLGKQAAGLAKGALSFALAKMQLTITIASLGKGHHIECKDLGELLDAEDTVREACKDLTRFLEAAASFDGSETVIAYDRGEERVHVVQSALPLLSEVGNGTAGIAATIIQASPKPPETEDDRVSPHPNAAEALGKHWQRLEERVIAFAQERGFSISQLQVRIVAAIIGLLAFYILIRIL